ncbi:MAG: hypothetical protein ABI690_20740 [Chloroflexota bacterium]
MSHYDEIRSQYGNSSPEEKLSLLRYAYKRYIPSIQGIAGILKEAGERVSFGIPDDFVKWCDAILKSAEDFSEVIEALLDTDDYNRETRRLNDEKHDKFEEMHWNNILGQLPELKVHSSLSEALLSEFDDSSIEQLREFEYKWPTSGRTMSEFQKRYDRGVRVGTHYQPGYIVWVYETIDQRNLTARKYEGITSSLNEARIILRSWMIDRISIEEIAHKYAWLQEVKS